MQEDKFQQKSTPVVQHGVTLQPPSCCERSLRVGVKSSCARTRRHVCKSSWSGFTKKVCIYIISMFEAHAAQWCVQVCSIQFPHFVQLCMGMTDNKRLLFTAALLFCRQGWCINGFLKCHALQRSQLRHPAMAADWLLNNIDSSDTSALLVNCDAHMAFSCQH